MSLSITLGSMAQALNLGHQVVAEYLKYADHIVEADPEAVLTAEQVAWLNKHLGGNGNSAAPTEAPVPEKEANPLKNDREGIAYRIRALEAELATLHKRLVELAPDVDVPPAEEVVLGPPVLNGPEALERQPDGSPHWRKGLAHVEYHDPINRSEHVEEVEVTAQFAEALNLLEQGDNVFITGQAGTGKSTLLKLFRQNSMRSAVVLAPTGIAALQVGGQTIHSFFNFPLHVIHEDDLKLDERRVQQYCALETLVIDEISMVRSDVMHAIDVILRRARSKKVRHLPFGGVQVVLIGDLHQLPPVVTRTELPVMRTLYGGEFFFHAPGYVAGHFQVVELKRLFRQRDPKFIGLLNQVRRGHAPPAVLSAFTERVEPRTGARKNEPPTGTILLMTTNRMADDHNNFRLDELPGEKRSFQATHEGRFDRKNLPAPEDLHLKAGAQVMFLRNDRMQGFVNGSIGTVVGFKEGEVPLIEVVLDGRSIMVDRAEWQDYEYVLDPKSRKLVTKVIGRYFQYPLKLAWAITVHKSQGLTFDKVHIAMGSGAFAHGQTYVALSRCRSLEGITLDQALTQKDMIIDRMVVDFLRNRYRPPVPSKEMSAEYEHWTKPQE